MRFMLPFMRTNGSDMYVGLAWPPRAVTAEAFQQIAPLSVKAAHADTKRPARMANMPCSQVCVRAVRSARYVALPDVRPCEMV